LPGPSQCSILKSFAYLVAKMKFSVIATTLLPLASAASFSKEEYVSGEVMAKMMEAKEVCRYHSTSHNVRVLTIAVCVG
jgi:hypothetical protein